MHHHVEQHFSSREAVGLFHDMDALQEAVGDLEITAFPRESISVMGGSKEVEEVFGSPTVTPEKAQDDPNTPRGVLVRSEEKSVGIGALIGAMAYVGATAAVLAVTSVAILPAAIIGLVAGAIVGGLLVRVLISHFNHSTAAQIRRGGLLLWVKTPDPKLERIACKIMRKHGADSVKVHEIKY